MSKSKPTWHLKVRSYQNTAWVSVWLIARDGAADSALMWGECNPAVVEAIAAATGVPVEREESPLSYVKPVEMGKAALTKVGDQAGLFE
jgi:hypothetical protein